MPNLQPPDAGTRARKRFYHRHYYPLQFPGNLLTILMKAAVALQRHPDQLVGTAVQHFLALSAEEQEASLSAYERYAPSGQDTPGNDIGEPRTDPMPSGRFPKDRWQHYWEEWLQAKQEGQMPVAVDGDEPI